ncbi:MAG: hypothetical protein WC717_05285 [Candidatus Micrarchaeia archaeon]
MNSGSAVVVKKNAGKKPFEERWSSLSREAQERLYSRGSKMLLPENYPKMTVEQGKELQFMRDNMKQRANGKAHPMVEQVMTC